MNTNKAIVVRGSDGICYITLNRPKAGNAFTLAMMKEMKETLRIVDEDESLKVAIITGTGKVFQAGADVAEMSTMNPIDYLRFNKSVISIDEELERLRQPVIAAINGPAIGGGLGLALACTLRVIAESAWIAIPEVMLGVCPGSGLMQRLCSLIGKGRAAYLLLVGDRIDSQEALKIGLVNRVVPDGDVMRTAEDIAKKIMANAQIAVEMTKDALELGGNLPVERSARFAGRNCSICFSTEDMREGFTAFLNKRAATFRGR